MIDRNSYSRPCLLYPSAGPTMVQGYCWLKLNINQHCFPTYQKQIAAIDLEMLYFIFCFQMAGPVFNYTNVELQFWIRLRRRPFFYVLNIIIPTIVLAVLSALTFIVPTDSGEQLSLGVSILLAFSVFMLILSENTPQTSENPPVLGKSVLFMWRNEMEECSTLVAFSIAYHKSHIVLNHHTAYDR